MLLPRARATRAPPEKCEGSPRLSRLSHRCDGRHWSRYQKLVWTVAREGRTYDRILACGSNRSRPSTDHRVLTSPRCSHAAPYREADPVDGLVTDDDGGVSILLHFNVPGISPKSTSEQAWESLHLPCTHPAPPAPTLQYMKNDIWFSILQA